MNVLRRDKQDQVLTLRATGVGIRAISRATGIHQDTISRFLRANGMPTRDTRTKSASRAVVFTVRRINELRQDLARFEDRLEGYLRQEVERLHEQVDRLTLDNSRLRQERLRVRELATVTLGGQRVVTKGSAAIALASLKRDLLDAINEGE